MTPMMIELLLVIQFTVMSNIEAAIVHISPSKNVPFHNIKPFLVG